MGSGGSVLIEKKSKIICPNNYNEEKFYKILDLYEKIINNEAEENEIFELSDNYVNDLLKKLEQEKVKTILIQQKKLLLHKLNLEHKMRILQTEYATNMKETNKILSKNTNSLEKRILKLETCTNEEKKKLFLGNVSNDDEINFEKFFNYMKDKIDDIENINWAESRKVNRIRQQRLSINITTPNFKNSITPKNN